MASDRFKRKESRTLEQRRKMKHKDRADDIPNCPSIDEIIKMPSTPDQLIKGEKNTATDSTPKTPPITDSKETGKTATTFTAQEVSTNSSVSQETFTVPTISSRRRRRGKRSRKRAKRFESVSTTNTDSTINATPSERRDDIPMCPDIEEICDINYDTALLIDDDMSVQRFSHALYQLLDDFFVLLHKLMEFSKEHPRPTTIVGFIIASYLTICYLELSIAALIELSVQAFWPIFHALMLVVERFSSNFGSFMRSSDEIIQGAYCDVAELWCKHFQMMCADRCSFFNMALERLKNK